MNKLLVVPPFVGELGWEILSWTNMVHKAYIEGQFSKCIVYGHPGRSLLYPFAEYRPMELASHDSECMLWRNFPTMKAELDAIGNQVVAECKKEFAEFDMFWYNNLQVFNKLMYERGTPFWIKPSMSIDREDRFSVVLCVRDRELSDFRNWQYQNWYDLATKLLEDNYDVIVIGGVRDVDAWKMPVGVHDLTNNTTIDQCVDIMHGTDLAIGGSTGTMHLASRCGTDHYVWGSPNMVQRYAESNWMGAAHCVLPVGWLPTVEQVYDGVKEFIG